MFLNKSLCFQWKHFSRNKGQKTLYGLVGLHKVFYRKCLRCQFSMETGQPFTKRGTCRCCPGLWLALFCMVWSLEVKQFQTVKEGRAVANVFRQWQNFDFDGSLESFQDWYFEFMFFFLAWLDKTAVNDWKVCGSMVCMALYGAIRMTFNRSTFATTGARECIRRDSRQNQPVGALFRPGRHAMAIPFIRWKQLRWRKCGNRNDRVEASHAIQKKWNTWCWCGIFWWNVETCARWFWKALLSVMTEILRNEDLSPSQWITLFKRLLEDEPNQFSDAWRHGSKGTLWVECQPVCKHVSSKYLH